MAPVPRSSASTLRPQITFINLYARALEGDTEALRVLGVGRPEQITLIDARPTAQRLLYLIRQ